MIVVARDVMSSRIVHVEIPTQKRSRVSIYNSRSSRKKCGKKDLTNAGK